MTRWAVIFDDDPGMRAVRQAREPDHLAYLARHRDTIRIAGGLRDAPGEAFVGGLWVVEAESRDAVVALIEGDPYYDPALRRFRILVWGKAFADPVLL